MARQGVKRADIFNAAQKLHARGIDPTNAAIREELGGTGSFSTISTHLSDWRAEKSAKIVVREIPEAVQNSMQEALNVAWTVACKVAEDKIEGIEQKAEDNINAINSNLAETLEEITRLERVVEALIQDNNNLLEKNNCLIKENGQKIGEIDAYKTMLHQTKKPAAGKKKAQTTKTTV